MCNFEVPTKFEDNPASGFREEMIDNSCISIHSDYIGPILTALTVIIVPAKF